MFPYRTDLDFNGSPNQKSCKLGEIALFEEGFLLYTCSYPHFSSHADAWCDTPITQVNISERGKREFQPHQCNNLVCCVRTRTLAFFDIDVVSREDIQYMCTDRIDTLELPHFNDSLSQFSYQRDPCSVQLIRPWGETCIDWSDSPIRALVFLGFLQTAVRAELCERGRHICEDEGLYHSIDFLFRNHMQGIGRWDQLRSGLLYHIYTHSDDRMDSFWII